MTEHEKLLQLYSKECQYAGAMRYLLTALQREIEIMESRKDIRIATRELITRLHYGLKTIKEEYE